MSTLHCLHHANPEALRRTLAAAQSGDALLLREDAVLLARHELLQHSLSQQTLSQTKRFTIHYVLQADVDARGVQTLLPGFIQPISDAEFVALTLQHDRVIAWR